MVSNSEEGTHVNTLLCGNANYVAIKAAIFLRGDCFTVSTLSYVYRDHPELCYVKLCFIETKK